MHQNCHMLQLSAKERNQAMAMKMGCICYFTGGRSVSRKNFARSLECTRRERFIFSSIRTDQGREISYRLGMKITKNRRADLECICVRPWSNDVLQTRRTKINFIIRSTFDSIKFDWFHLEAVRKTRGAENAESVNIIHCLYHIELDQRILYEILHLIYFIY